MDFSAEGILARLKGELKNGDTHMEGSFTMDNLQAVAEELARINAMLAVPIMGMLEEREDDMGTSGNERHYVRWAKEATDAGGNRIVGNAKVDSPRDGTGFVSIAVIARDVRSPTEEEIGIVQGYIDSMRPVGADPVVSAAESVPVLVEVTAKRKAGYSAEAVESNLEKALRAYMSEIAFRPGNAELNYYTVSMLLGGAEGVSEIRSLTVNGAKESLTVDYNKYFALEELRIDVTE